jgi:hypothetical protein
LRSSTPVPESVCSSLWSIAPGKSKPLLDENLPEVPASHVDAGERAAVAVLATMLDLQATGAGKSGQPFLGPEAYNQLALAAGSEALGRVDVQKADPLVAESNGVPVDDDGPAPVECLGGGGQSDDKRQQNTEAPLGA